MSEKGLGVGESLSGRVVSVTGQIIQKRESENGKIVARKNVGTFIMARTADWID